MELISFQIKISTLCCLAGIRLFAAALITRVMSVPTASSFMFVLAHAHPQCTAFRGLPPHGLPVSAQVVARAAATGDDATGHEARRAAWRLGREEEEEKQQQRHGREGREKRLGRE